MEYVWVLIEYNKFDDKQSDSIYSVFSEESEAIARMNLYNNWSDKNSEQLYLKIEKHHFNNFLY